VVEIPCNDAVELALPVLAAFYGGPAQVSRCVSVQPLFAEHREERGEEGKRKTCEEDGLDFDYPAGRASPSWQGRGVVSEGGAVEIVDEDTEESCGYIVRVFLEVGVDLDDECGGDGGEQTGLSLSLARFRKNSVRDSRISGWCSNPRRASS